MASPGDWTPTILSGLGTLLTGVLGYFGIRLHNKVDKLETDAKTEAGERITRTELMGHMDILRADNARLREDRERMHGENQAILKVISNKLDDHATLREKVDRAEKDIQELRQTRYRRRPRQGQ